MSMICKLLEGYIYVAYVGYISSLKTLVNTGFFIFPFCTLFEVQENALRAFPHPKHSTARKWCTGGLRPPYGRATPVY